MKVIYFDTETTGLNSKFDRIIELAMLTVEDGEIKDEYDKFVNIGRDLPAKITQITGITNDDLILKGESEAHIAEDLKNNLTPDTLMIAHNCQFDLSFVYSLLERHYPNEAYEIVSNLKWIDTVTVLKDRKEFPHKLIDAVKYYGIEEVNFHRAIDDTKALYNVTQALKEERNDLKEYINLFGYNPKYEVKNKFPFIKYKKQFFTKRMVDSDKILRRK
ncbi:MAG: 3'-5' exonuclease [Methanobrevibacter sp.]|uniref:3'-5' exonuclease n=1 Tax=Methanobrevibacter sp. TaxID=66852 RepID=UPI0025CE4FD1|nr:3'-5' exonuclease [Methanobrevibacter sp.]MBR3113950.1 3'-5' exonuclease [Methanobrevibacter sp.]